MIITVDNVIGSLTAEDQEDLQQLELLYEGSKVNAPGYEYTQLYKLFKKSRGKRGWDGKVRLLKRSPTIKDTLIFPVGLFNAVTLSIKEATVSDYRILNTPTLITPKVPLRDYQWEAITKAYQNTVSDIWWPRGILHMATGSGKTECAAAMIQMTTPAPTLFLVHRKDLLYQTKERFEKYGIVCGILGDGKHNISNVTVATIQTIAAMMRAGKDCSFLAQYEQVFFDEAHLIAATLDKGNTFSKVSALLTGAFMRWGLTATPFMRDKYSDRILEGVTGDILFAIKSKELIEQDFLTPPTVKIIQTTKIKGCAKSWPDCYNDGIVLNSGRNWQILELAKNAPKPCLILVNHVAHGKILQAESSKYGLNPPFLSGIDTSMVRRDFINKMKLGKLPILIASTIFDEGLDIPNLRTIILAGAGKSKIKMLQRVGRGMRLNKNKTEVVIYDFNDTSAPILQRHTKLRMETWKDEGFKIE